MKNWRAKLGLVITFIVGILLAMASAFKRGKADGAAEGEATAAHKEVATERERTAEESTTDLYKDLTGGRP